MGVFYYKMTPENMKTQITTESLRSMNKSLWPGFARSPEDPVEAEYYYYNDHGDVLPSPEKATYIARELVASLFIDRFGNPRKPGAKRKLSLLDTTTEPGSKIILDLAKTVAIKEFDVAPEDITLIDRSVKKEKERLLTLKRLREEGKETERQEYLKAVEEEEYISVDRLRNDELGDPNVVGGQLTIRDTDPEALKGFNEQDLADLQKSRVKSRMVRMQHHVDWMLSGYPTKSTVEVDKKMNPGVEITQELEVYQWIKACERPREEIAKAQEKLAQTLNNSYRLRILAYGDDTEKATDVVLATVKVDEQGNIVPRRWFNHPGYENNFPGSEVFGVDLRDGAFGTVTYPFPVMFDGFMLPNVQLTFKNGRVESGDISTKTQEDKKAQEHFEKKMNDQSHPGNRFLGEIGIGTSPYPTFNTRDIGFNEKRTGVHLALGMCYTDKASGDELGNPTDLDNGNQSYADIHADLVMPSSKKTLLQLWAEVGTLQADGTVKKEWRLVMHEGAFVKKLDDGRYQADDDMTILNSLDADTEPFISEFKEFPPLRR